MATIASGELNLQLGELESPGNMVSADFDNRWSHDNTTVTYGFEAPDGSMTAFRVDSNEGHNIVADWLMRDMGGPVAYTVYAKPGATGLNAGTFGFYDLTVANNLYFIIFDFQGGYQTSWPGGNGQTTVEDAGRGWFKITMEIDVPTGHSISVYAGMAGGVLPTGYQHYLWNPSVRITNEAAVEVGATTEATLDGLSLSAQGQVSTNGRVSSKLHPPQPNPNFDHGLIGWENLWEPLVLKATSGDRMNLVSTTAGAASILQSELIPVIDGDDLYDLSISLRQTAGGPCLNIAGVFFYDALGHYIPGTDGTGNYPLGWIYTDREMGWVERSTTAGFGSPPPSPYGTSKFPAGTVTFRLVAFLNYDSVADAVVEVDSFSYRGKNGGGVLAPLTGSAEGEASLSATANQPLAELTGAADGTVSIEGGLTESLVGVSVQLSGGAVASGSVDAAFDNPRVVGQGRAFWPIKPDIDRTARVAVPFRKSSVTVPFGSVRVQVPYASPRVNIGYKEPVVRLRAKEA